MEARFGVAAGVMLGGRAAGVERALSSASAVDATDGEEGEEHWRTADALSSSQDVGECPPSSPSSSHVLSHTQPFFLDGSSFGSASAAGDSGFAARLSALAGEGFCGDFKKSREAAVDAVIDTKLSTPAAPDARIAKRPAGAGTFFTTTLPAPPFPAATPATGGGFSGDLAHKADMSLPLPASKKTSCLGSQSVQSFSDCFQLRTRPRLKSTSQLKETTINMSENDITD